MKLAIMQPYFLPYIGYWQMLAAVDKFVVLDDAAFIPRGWINRNRILVNGSPHMFTLPVSGASQNRLICEIERADTDKWRQKFLSTLRQNYGQCPYHDVVVCLLEHMLANPERTLSRYILDSLRTMADYLGITTELIIASTCHGKHDLKGQERIIDICKREEADSYFNLPGGILLYERDKFAGEGIELRFVMPNETSYPQKKAECFVPWLSIIDILMNVGRERTQKMLGDFTLGTPPETPPATARDPAVSGTATATPGRNA